MSITSVLSAATGNITKAILVVRNPEIVLWNESQSNRWSSSDDEFAVAEAEAEVLYEKMSSLQESGLTTSLSNMTSLTNEYIMIEVQYNPTSLRFSSRGGKYMDYSSTGNFGTASESMAVPRDVPFEKTMTVTLVLDDMDPDDCFGASLNTSTTALAKNLVSALSSTTHSVKAKAEFLLSLNLHTGMQDVYFIYGMTLFHGQVSGVNVTYTMFNMDGNPVRANVTMKLTQLNDERYSYDQMEWVSKYHDFIQEHGGDDSSSNTL